MSKRYYILNRNSGFTTELALWWAPDGRGYVNDIDKAGVYSEEEAANIVRNRPHEDEAIEVSVVLSAARRYVHKDRLLPLPRLRVARDGS